MKETTLAPEQKTRLQKTEPRRETTGAMKGTPGEPVARLDPGGGDKGGGFYKAKKWIEIRRKKKGREKRKAAGGTCTS